MITKTVRSRFNHEVGDKVEGCTILEKCVIAPPDAAEMRRGIYDYLVESAPIVEKVRATRSAAKAAMRATAPAPNSFTRATPAEMGGNVIRRVPAR